MSIMMILEISSDVPSNAIVEAVKPFATFETQKEKKIFSGNLSVSNMYFKIDVAPQDKHFVTEKADSVQHLTVSARVFFSIVPSQYDLCINQIIKVMEIIANATKATFVLSKEYETVYAIGKDGTIDYKRSFFNENRDNGSVSVSAG